jgi:SAM-dependent methyltransferase
MSQFSINHWNDYYSQNKDFGLMRAEMLDIILGYCNTRMPKTALDIGCGTGQLTRELYHRDYQCDGIDISSVAIERARHYTTRKNELTYLIGDIETIDSQLLPHPPYALTTCKLVYAFIKDKPRFLARIKRWLVQGGTFILITPLPANEPKKPAITVEYDQTMKELCKHFAHVTTLKAPGTTYFICKDS